MAAVKKANRARRTSPGKRDALDKKLAAFLKDNADATAVDAEKFLSSVGCKTPGVAHHFPAWKAFTKKRNRQITEYLRANPSLDLAGCAKALGIKQASIRRCEAWLNRHRTVADELLNGGGKDQGPEAEERSLLPTLRSIDSSLKRIADFLGVRA